MVLIGIFNFFSVKRLLGRPVQQNKKINDKATFGLLDVTREMLEKFGSFKLNIFYILNYVKNRAYILTLQ